MSRVLLKLSGESFADQDTNFGIESNTLTRIADEISKASETGVQNWNCCRRRKLFLEE